MNILLDECVDARLANEIVGHVVTTVPQRGWDGMKDGPLLQLAALEFDVFITVDSNLPFQQNLSKFDLRIVILKAPGNRLADLKLLVPQLQRLLPHLTSHTATTISQETT
ncbi:MAG TPA: DUF5615 family PIN-like protein [Abditibacteriaceae bacterium]